MAFVFKSEKKPSYIPKQASDAIGPGAYFGNENEFEDQIEVNLRPKRVAFNTSADKNKNLPNNSDETPGPGKYDIAPPSDGSKIIFQSPENEIKILEVPKPISVFKSQTKRFKENLGKEDQILPGPGSYNIDVPTIKIDPMKKTEKKMNIIEHLMKVNKYQSIPSIPGKLHSFGYTENENNELELNKNTQVQYRGTKLDMVGPGSYEQKPFQSRKRV